MPRFRGWALIAVLAAVCVLLPGAALADTNSVTIEVRITELLNAARRDRGLAPLRLDLRLVSATRSHSGDLAAAGYLYHDPHAASEMPPGTSQWGENIGYSTNNPDPAKTLHDAFMASSSHRAAMLSPSFTEVGIGVRVSGETTWVTERFTAGAPVAYTPALDATTGMARGLLGGGQAHHAVLVRDDAFPDALAAGPLAGGDGALLLTPFADVLHPHVELALADILPSGRTVYIVGGHAAVHPAIDGQLAAHGWHVQRIAGADRFDTALQVARAVVAREGTPQRVLLLSGEDWPDAAAASAFGARAGVPVLLAQYGSLPAPTVQGLQELDPPRVTALGGRAVMSDVAVEAADAVRVWGETREHTSSEAARLLWRRTDASSTSHWVAVPSHDWTFALTAAPLSARFDAPMLLVGADVHPEMASYLDGLGYEGPEHAEVVAHGPVSGDAMAQLAALVD